MSSLLLLLLSAVLVNLVALTSNSQWQPFERGADLFESALGMAAAVALAIPLTAVVAMLLDAWVLAPLQLQYLRTPAFAAIVLTGAPCAEAALRRFGKFDPARPAFMLLMITNCVVFGTAWVAVGQSYSLGQTILLACGSAVVFGALLLAFSALHERLQHAGVPAVFRNAPLALITAGIGALGFMGFTGLIQE